MKRVGRLSRPSWPGKLEILDDLESLVSLERLAQLAVLATLVLLAACGGPSREELASLAAQGYYNHLIHGEYEAFLEGRCGADSLPADYRSQLLDGYKQFMSRQDSVHQGVREVRVMRAVADTLQPQVDVFLVVCFGDSVNEEVVVPMVELPDGRWRMK